MSTSAEYSTSSPLSNEQLIAKAISTLENDQKTDAYLLNILSEHLVRMNPKSTAVSDAAREIEALAEKRAERFEDGPADHD